MEFTTGRSEVQAHPLAVTPLVDRSATDRAAWSSDADAGRAEGQAAVPLGIYGKSKSQPENCYNSSPEWDWRCRRFALQAAGVELVPEQAIRGCLRWPYEQAIRILTGEGAACYRGLQTCGSVWSCAVCASRITEERRQELATVVAVAGERGLVPYLATFTVRHERADDLGATLGGLLAARSRMRTGRVGVQLRERWGLAGSVRALEVTHGGNGWHPHLHELLFLRGECDPVELEADLLRRWSVAVASAGLRDVNAHGCRVQFADMAVGEYVAKYGRERTWGPEHELAKSGGKTGRVGGRTPMDLLSAYGFDHDEQAGSLWQHYARTFRGRRQLVWSRGLRAELGLTDERGDEEIAADVGAGCRFLAAVMSVRQWRCVVGNDARAELLQVAATGGAGAVWQFLRSIGAEGTVEELLGQRDVRVRAGMTLAGPIS